jgi:hypothetical protein
LLLFWVASLVLVSMATIAVAQTRRLPAPMLSGNDIGFRVDGVDQKGKPVGTLMLRFNGDWVEAGAAMTLRPLK